MGDHVFVGGQWRSMILNDALWWVMSWLKGIPFMLVARPYCTHGYLWKNQDMNGWCCGVWLKLCYQVWIRSARRLDAASHVRSTVTKSLDLFILFRGHSASHIFSGSMDLDASFFGGALLPTSQTNPKKSSRASVHSQSVQKQAASGNFMARKDL